jgi:hypothetical protein
MANKSFNISLLSKQDRDDIQLEKRAAMLIQKVKLGHMTQFAVKTELARELNPEVHAKFKAYLNKYRCMK